MINQSISLPNLVKYKELIAWFFNLELTSLPEDIIQSMDGVTSINLPFAVKSKHPQLIEVFNNADLPTKNIVINTRIIAKRTKSKRLNNVKNIIAVASGKGGVGKSTTAVNLAFALQAEGAKVGILDADIYGPSVPIMLGNPEAHPVSEDNRHMLPIDCYGVVANSIGYLVSPENATIWRGPMASKAFQQLANETLWPELDYLIVDMPPGTGDIQLTLAETIPVTAAIVVTTPQDLALADAVKGIAMFERVSVPVLGLVENMSFYQCRTCGEKDFIFSIGGGSKLAEQFDIALLGQLPLDIHIREHADGGVPIIIDMPDGPLTQGYLETARSLSVSLAMNPDIPEDKGIDVVEKR